MQFFNILQSWSSPTQATFMILCQVYLVIILFKTENLEEKHYETDYETALKLTFYEKRLVNVFIQP